ncbi:hypothetical protein [Serratia sp. Ag1]|uniref:hypothetical protein n=1 Tax=Serratia sp. Ag1 TaxID=1524467 RepID=UPI00050138C3|nr:hypothetical protein [Serratia sp. Ag1]KFK98139.1 hypothetical protein IV04_14705 [Serratia sp. Ag1]
MSQENKQKAIHYKRAVIKNASCTLQSLLESAVGKHGIREKVDSRQECLNPSDENSGFRFLNKSDNYKSVFFGQLISFEKGRSQALLTMSGDVPFYDIKAITSSEIELKIEGSARPANKMRLKREFVDSFLYFGVYGNHMVMLQSSSLRARELEDHLNWLLTECSLLDDQSAIILQDKPTKDAVEKLNAAPVKSIKIGSPIKGKSELQDTMVQTGPGAEFRKVKSVKFMPAGKGGDVIAAVLGNDWVDQLDLGDVLDEANLQVNLEITYLRKTTQRGQKAIDAIATSLRHSEGDDVTVSLKGGGVLKGNDLKLSGNVSIKYIDGLVYEDDLYLKMHTWLSTKINVGELDKAD